MVASRAHATHGVRPPSEHTQSKHERTRLSEFGRGRSAWCEVQHPSIARKRFAPCAAPLGEFSPPTERRKIRRRPERLFAQCLGGLIKFSHRDQHVSDRPPQRSVVGCTTQRDRERL
jgi:hypothetical protein